MNTACRVLFFMSVLANGLLAGLIAGRLTSPPAACSCDRTKAADVDAGPFPTGWVVPEPGPPPKPTGGKR